MAACMCTHHCMRLSAWCYLSIGCWPSVLLLHGSCLASFLLIPKLQPLSQRQLDLSHVLLLASAVLLRARCLLQSTDFLVQDLLLHCMTDPLTNATVELEQVDERSGGMPEGQRCDVLALRGLLACGVLVHTLQMRHLVDYGVNRWGEGGEKGLGGR